MGLNFFILGMVIAVFGISLFLPARNARKRDQIYEAWPTAKGTVIANEVVAQPPLATKLGRQILQYDVVVKYQFRSGGQLHFGATCTTKKKRTGSRPGIRPAPASPFITIRTKRGNATWRSKKPPSITGRASRSSRPAPCSSCSDS
jgi:hypothetical protein